MRIIAIILCSLIVDCSSGADLFEGRESVLSNTGQENLLFECVVDGMVIIRFERKVSTYEITDECIRKFLKSVDHPAWQAIAHARIPGRPSFPSAQNVITNEMIKHDNELIGYGLSLERYSECLNENIPNLAYGRIHIDLNGNHLLRAVLFIPADAPNQQHEILSIRRQYSDQEEDCMT